MRSKAFWVCLGLGAALRLIPLTAPIPADDGAIRLLSSVRWAQHPEWFGLGGQWPPLVMYLQGLLIRVGADPVWTAHLMNYAASVATLYLVYLLTLQLFANQRAATMALLLASLYWLHITIVNTNLIENLYLPLLLLALYWAVKATQQVSAPTSLAVGIGVSVAGLILMRHEGRVVFIVLLGYFLVTRQWRVALWLGVINSMLLCYLLYENWALRGHWAADLISARENFEYAGAVKGHVASLAEKLHGLRRVFLFMPSIFFLALAAVGMWAHRHRRATYVLALPSAASLILLVYSALFSPLVPFARYFLPIFMPLAPFAGAALQYLAETRSKQFAWGIVALILLTQVAQSVYAQAKATGTLHWTYLLPRRIPNSQQQVLEQQIARLPLHTRVCLVANPNSEWHLVTALLNTRRFDLLPHLMQGSYYDQYRARPTEPLVLSRETLSRADFVFLHPASPDADRARALLPPATLIFSSDFLVVYRIGKTQQTTGFDSPALVNASNRNPNESRKWSN